jgi:hypothetical protein
VSRFISHDRTEDRSTRDERNVGSGTVT